MLRKLKIPKKRICCCIVNLTLIAIEFILTKAPCQYFPKKRLMAFLQSVFMRKCRKHIVRSTDNSDVMLDPKAMKYFVSWLVGAGFCLQKKVLLCQERQNFKIIFHYDVMMTSRTPMALNPW